MKQYRTPLERRLKESARLNERYRSDPDFRLRRINYERARRGYPLIASLDEARVR